MGDSIWAGGGAELLQRVQREYDERIQALEDRIRECSDPGDVRVLDERIVALEAERDEELRRIRGALF